MVKDKKVKLGIIALATLAITAVTFIGFYNSPKLDTSSEQTVQTSLKKMRESLSSEDQGKLESALKVLVFSKLDLASIMMGKVTSDTFVSDTLRPYEGKSAKQIIAAADSVLAERKEEQKKQAQVEIEEIEAKIKNAAASQQLLSKIEVLKSRFYHDRSGYISEPVIDLTIKNGSEHAISRIYFNGVLASPNRSVPWVKDTFNYSIKGGLEPGESANWKLNPNMFSDWGKADAPKDAILTVTVIRIDGADDKELANAEGASPETLERLKELQRFVAED